MIPRSSDSLRADQGELDPEGPALRRYDARTLILRLPDFEMRYKAAVDRIPERRMDCCWTPGSPPPYPREQTFFRCSKRCVPRREGLRLRWAVLAAAPGHYGMGRLFQAHAEDQGIEVQGSIPTMMPWPGWQRDSDAARVHALARVSARNGRRMRLSRCPLPSGTVRGTGAAIDQGVTVASSQVRSAECALWETSSRMTLVLDVVAVARGCLGFSRQSRRLGFNTACQHQSEACSQGAQ